MTNSTPDPSPNTDVLPPEDQSLSIPPPVPQKKPGLLRRLFTSRKKQQAVAIQNGYLEMVDLIRSIRTHLDRQEDVQTRVLGMLEKVPDTMERQHEVMNLFKEQLQGNLENDKKLTESMGRLNDTLSSMDDSQKASARTVTDLIHRSRESEQLLREVMRRSERRVTFLLVFFFLVVIGLGWYFLKLQQRPADTEPAAPAAVEAAVTPEPAETAPETAPAVKKEPAAQPETTTPEFQTEEQAAAEKQAAADKKAEELKQKTEKEQKKAEKKAKAEKKRKDREAQKKAEQEAKAKAEQEEAAAKAAAEKTESDAAATAAPAPADGTSTAVSPEFTLECIQPAVGEPVPDKPVSLP